MTINTPNSGLFQQQLTQAVVALRNAFQDVQNLNDYITAQGGSAFLTTVIGLSANDAAVVTSTFANLSNLNNAYLGSGTIPAAFNFKANSNLLWAGN